MQSEAAVVDESTDFDFLRLARALHVQEAMFGNPVEEEVEVRSKRRQRAAAPSPAAYDMDV